MSYLPLLKQFLQQETQSSFGKEKASRTLYLACWGLFRRNRSLLFTNELWKNPLPSLGPRVGGPAVQPTHCSHGWSPQPHVGHPQETGVKDSAENAGQREENGKRNTRGNAKVRGGDAPWQSRCQCSPWRNPCWSKQTLLTGLQPLESPLQSRGKVRGRRNSREEPYWTGHNLHPFCTIQCGCRKTWSEMEPGKSGRKGGVLIFACFLLPTLIIKYLF